MLWTLSSVHCASDPNFMFCSLVSDSTWKDTITVSEEADYVDKGHTCVCIVYI